MKVVAHVLGICVSGLFATMASAEVTSEILFEHKHWQVEAVAFDDGSFACLAEVEAPGESFSVWTYPDQSVRIQFFSTAWDFGEGDTANLSVQIDRRGPWTLNNAELYQNSVLFDLPDSDEGVRFLIEVAQGSRLYLSTEEGESVQDYSLAGSRASMNALGECGSVLTGIDSNPFK